MDPCASKKCESTEVCRAGYCVDPCSGPGSPTCVAPAVCDPTTAACVDKCAGKTCDAATEACDASTGSCVARCETATNPHGKAECASGKGCEPAAGECREIC